MIRFGDKAGDGSRIFRDVDNLHLGDVPGEAIGGGDDSEFRSF